MDNVVVFPKTKRGSPPQTIEEVLENVEKIRLEHSDFIIEEVIPQLYMFFLDLGIDVMKQDCTKENVMLMESIRSLVYKHNNLEHPLQQLSEDLFTIASNTDTGINYMYNAGEDTEETENNI
jgi:hypothetical protein